MDWRICLVWITLISTSSSRCSQHDIPTISPYNQYGHSNTTDQTDTVLRSNTVLRSDTVLRSGTVLRSDTDWSSHDQDDDRTGTTGRRESNDKTDASLRGSSDRRDTTVRSGNSDWPIHGQNTDRPVQRMSERSLPLYSSIQRIQENERKRFSPNENRLPRIENGTSKIINSGVLVASRRGLVTEQPLSQDRVVFPGPTSQGSFVPRIPEECLRTGICEDVPDYPIARVANIIENLGDAREKYKVDELDTPEIAQRIGPPEEVELCDYALKVVIPQAAPDKDGNWHYILNQKDKPLQGFHVEICKEDKSPCAKLAHFYSGYEATCKQKYVLRYMAGLNEKGEMVDKAFKLPSCCSCVVRQN